MHVPTAAACTKACCTCSSCRHRNKPTWHCSTSLHRRVTYYLALITPTTLIIKNFINSNKWSSFNRTDSSKPMIIMSQCFVKGCPLAQTGVYTWLVTHITCWCWLIKLCGVQLRLLQERREWCLGLGLICLKLHLIFSCISSKLLIICLLAVPILLNFCSVVHWSIQHVHITTYSLYK